MLNIIFGIIIDTFSGLRSEKNDRAFKTTETCFVCSLGRQVFDRAANSPDGFKRHIREDHHMWNYLYFIFFLWEQDKDDDDGLEYYVRHKLYTKEITWFPLHKAMCLNQEISGTEKTTQDLTASVNDSHGVISKKVSDFQLDIDHLLHGLTHTLADKNYSGGGDIFTAEEKGGNRYDGMEDEEAWNPSWGHNVSVSIKEIRAIDIPDDELPSLNFRLITDVGMYNSSAISAVPETKSAVFDQGEPFAIANGYVDGDPKAIQFQILQSTGAGISKFIAVIEVAVAEFMAGEDGATLSKSFQKPGQTAPCWLTMNCHYEKATFAGGGGEEDELDSDAD